MNKSDIKIRLSALPFAPNQYWVVAGGAMVLHGIKPDTPDIDLGCTTAMADILQQTHEPTYLKDGTRSFHFDDIEIFENWLSGEICHIDGIAVVSIGGLIAMKTELGREKDLRDIETIKAYLAKAPSPAPHCV